MKTIFTLAITLFTLLISVDSFAKNQNISAKAYIVKDIEQNKILLSKNADRYLPPASTTKLMTLYILFEKIEKREFKLKDYLTVSKKARQAGGSRMFVDEGSKVRVVDLMKGIAVSSGNDASIVIAESIAGSEKNFVKLMNKKAKELGMNKTHFVNATGWDDKGHVSTASDLSILGERIYRDFPQYYKIFSLKSFKHNNIRQYNRNTLLGKLGVDGLKTGHVRSVGYNMVASAKTNNSRYMVVVIGSKTSKLRASDVKNLLEMSYKQYKNTKILSSDEIIAQQKVFLGDSKYVDLGVEEDLYINLTEKEFKTLRMTANYDNITRAPVYIGQKLGTLEITYSNIDKPMYIDLVAKQASEELSGLSYYKELIDYNLNKHEYINK